MAFEYFQLGWSWDDEYSRRNFAHQLEQSSIASFTKIKRSEWFRVLMGMIVSLLPVILISKNCITAVFAFHKALSTGTHRQLLGIQWLNVKELVKECSKQIDSLNFSSRSDYHRLLKKFKDSTWRSAFGPSHTFSQSWVSISQVSSPICSQLCCIQVLNVIFIYILKSPSVSLHLSVDITNITC